VESREQSVQDEKPSRTADMAAAAVAAAAAAADKIWQLYSVSW
jgi:hypothetical protein